MADEKKQKLEEKQAKVKPEEEKKTPEWLNEAKTKKDESGPSDLPAWVKNASAKDGETEVSPDKPAETDSEEPKIDEVAEKVEKSVETTKTEEKPIVKAEVKKDVKTPLSIFDSIKDTFAKKGPNVKKAGIEAAAAASAKGENVEKKEVLTPEEKKRIQEAEKLYQEGMTSIRDLIAPSSMDVQLDHIKLGGLYAQSFYVYAYPRYLESNWLSPVVNFDVTMDIAQFIYPIDSAAIMKVLRRKVAQMQSSVRIGAEKGMVSDPALETALGDAEELRTQIQRGQEKFYQFGLYFTIYSDSLKKLNRVAKQLESLLGGKLIMTKRTDFQAEHGMNSTFPLAYDELDVNLNMNTSPLSSTFPFSSSELTSNKGILYGLNRHNDSLIIFDRFSLENANSVIFAKSGAGKSYGVKLEILRTLMYDVDVIVIDPENEYEALCDVVGGSYLKVSLNSDKRINPFDLPAPLKDEEVKPGDLLRSNIISLHGLLKIMLGGVSPIEEGILDKALTDVYSLRGITMEVEDPSGFPAPTMEDLYDILNSMEGGRELATRLAKFTKGTYAGIFNQPTNVDLTSGLVVFSIRDLEDALRPIAMYIILNYIWNRVRSSLRKRLLIIDEAWSLMQYDDSARFLYGLVKRARKYYLGVTTITQDVEDFMANKYGKPIITNSSMQLLLKQSTASLDILEKVFNLTEGEKYLLLNSGVGQGLFFAGLKHVAIQIIASYGEDKLVTTNPEELLRTQAESVEYEEAASTEGEDAFAETETELPVEATPEDASLEEPAGEEESATDDKVSEKEPEVEPQPEPQPEPAKDPEPEPASPEKPEDIPPAAEEPAASPEATDTDEKPPVDEPVAAEADEKPPVDEPVTTEADEKSVKDEPTEGQEEGVNYS